MTKFALTCSSAVTMKPRRAEHGMRMHMASGLVGSAASGERSKKRECQATEPHRRGAIGGRCLQRSKTTQAVPILRWPINWCLPPATCHRALTGTPPPSRLTNKTRPFTPSCPCWRVGTVRPSITPTHGEGGCLIDAGQGAYIPECDPRHHARAVCAFTLCRQTERQRQGKTTETVPVRRINSNADPPRYYGT